jgi:hypothetical protein
MCWENVNNWKSQIDKFEIVTNDHRLWEGQPWFNGLIGKHDIGEEILWTSA